MNVLGIKIAGHDTGAALISGTRIIAIAEERLNRIKHAHNYFPHLAIDYCLNALGVSDEDLDLIVLDRTSKEPGRTGAEIFRNRVGSRFKDIPVEMIGHHDAHAATAFLCSPFEEAAILVYDGNGDVFRSHTGSIVAETETLYRGRGNTIIQLDKVVHAKHNKSYPFTWGIGRLYTFFSREYLSFGSGNEGKMMGLASYGDDSFLKQFPIERWIGTSAGQAMCNSDLHYTHRSATAQRLARGERLPLARLGEIAYYGVRARVRVLKNTFSKRLFQHTGSPVYGNPGIFGNIRLPRPSRSLKDKLPDPYWNSVAYAAQKIFETFALSLGLRLRAMTGLENLCVSGGCALNIDANRNFITKAGFKNLFVQPASSDCGIPLGCALWGLHIILKQPRFWEMKQASLGRRYSSAEIDEAIAARQDKIDSKISPDVAVETASLLAEGKIIGWFQGGSEYGPRALGNRSILCDARDPKMKDTLNARVKNREMWRPFATSMLAERLQDWFDLEPNVTTAFMLLAAPIHPHKQSEVPSIVHVDGTCRMQTLTKEANGIYYDLIKAFEDKTGVPLLLNTSFNLGGDPIVETPADALDTFLRTDMDYLVLEDRIVRKRTVHV